MATVMVEAKEAVIMDQLGMWVEMLVLPADFVTSYADKIGSAQHSIYRLVVISLVGH